MRSPLKEFREYMGLTQMQFAKLAGVSQGHVSEVESGVADAAPALVSYIKKSVENGEGVLSKQEKFMREKSREWQADMNRRSLKSRQYTRKQ